MNTFLHELCSILDDQQSLVIATITEHSGSTPRGNGAQMAILHDGRILGTVGGGLLEARCMVVGKQLLQRELGASALCRFHLDNDEAAKAAMVCGGSLTVILEHIGRPVTEGPHALEDDQSPEITVQCMQDVKRISQDGETVSMTSVYMWDKELVLNGALDSERIQNADISEKIEASAAKFHVQGMRAIDHKVTADAHPSLSQCPSSTAEDSQAVRMLLDDHQCICTVRFSQKPQLFIFGAGHVAQPTAQLGTMMGFAVTVIDDRDEFANPERFPSSRVVVCSSYDTAFSDLHITEQSYIAIMTRGHLHDGTVLKQALTTPARYVGMIGSSRKRDALYAELRKEGVQDDAIARCHCPIGLTIKAQSPEEIAVSIMAELILCRATKA
ncbi:MAG: XdhC family protein [Pseudomonadota bacterium]